MVIIDIRSKTPRTNGTRPLSSIKKIARHHSATDTGSWESFWPYWNKSKGWGTGGYHEIILRNGDVQLCYDPNEITNGVANHNSTTYHICVVGNGSFTDAQEKAFDERCKLAMKRFGLSISDVLGHNEFSGTSTSCPGINMTMVRGRLAMGSNAVAVDEPVIKVGGSKLYQPTSKAIKDSTEEVLKQLEAGDNRLSSQWRKKLTDGTLTDSDAVGLVFVAISRGLLSK